MLYEVITEKMFGIFPHRIVCEHTQLLKGFDDIFHVPHSRHTSIRKEDILKVENLEILAESDISGVHIVCDKDNRQFFLMGHSEYDKFTLAKEYFRDVDKGLDIKVPYNYFPDDNPALTPDNKWCCHGNLLFFV